MQLRKFMGGVLAGTMLAMAVLAPASARMDERIEIHVEEQETAAPSSVETSLYRVRTGDSLWTIAEKHRTDVGTLADINGLSESDFIREGQVLTLPGGAIGTQTHRVRDGENLWTIADRYRVSVSQLIRENNLTDPDLLRAGQELTVPVASSGGPAAPAGVEWQTLVWPVNGPLTDGFGMREDRPHYGVDVAADHGEVIRAAAGGCVIHAGPAGTFGLLVILDHGNGLTTYYAHCSEINVQVGDQVTCGQQIARVGDTGRSFGPHLHFETRWDGQPYDPLLYLPATR